MNKQSDGLNQNALAQKLVCIVTEWVRVEPSIYDIKLGPPQCTFVCVCISKVAGSSLQHFQRLRFCWVIIATLYQLML